MTTGFLLGRLVATPGALALTNTLVLAQLLARHSVGDWGELDRHDQAVNNRAVGNGGRILSAYTVGTETVWIVTEADRSCTTFLLPSEY